MVHPRRNKEHLGIDSNVLIAYLIPDHPAHGSVKRLASWDHAVNPTVSHEAYHTAVFKLKRRPDQTVRTLLSYMGLALCLPATAGTVELGLKLALRHGLGGRDALILATCLLSKEVRRFVTMDNNLLSLIRVAVRKKMLKISSPAQLNM